MVGNFEHNKYLLPSYNKTLKDYSLPSFILPEKNGPSTLDWILFERLSFPVTNHGLACTPPLTRSPLLSYWLCGVLTTSCSSVVVAIYLVVL